MVMQEFFSKALTGVPVYDFLATGTLLLHFGLIAALLVYLAERFTGLGVYEKLGINKLNSYISLFRNELVFLQATVATSGSLYMSEVLGWTPCFKCWLQRGIIYPIAVISLATIVLMHYNRRDDILPDIIEDMRDYVIPILLIGIPIAVYHSLEQRFMALAGTSCSLTAPCYEIQSMAYGYITIPVMSLTAMVVMLFLLWRYSE